MSVRLREYRGPPVSLEQRLFARGAGRRPSMNLRSLLFLTTTCWAFRAIGAGQPDSSPGMTEAMLKGLKARSIGPAVMGGRVSDIAIDPDNPYTFYVGLATGGLWKSGNNG